MQRMAASRYIKGVCVLGGGDGEVERGLYALSLFLKETLLEYELEYLIAAPYSATGYKSFHRSFLSKLPYNRKHSRMKTFVNFVDLGPSAKVLSANYKGRGL